VKQNMPLTARDLAAAKSETHHKSDRFGYCRQATVDKISVAVRANLLGTKNQQICSLLVWLSLVYDFKMLQSRGNKSEGMGVIV
jgi:hypothetical protein